MSTWTCNAQPRGGDGSLACSLKFGHRGEHYDEKHKMSFKSIVPGSSQYRERMKVLKTLKECP